MSEEFPHKFAVAPMMDWTDRHCRFFHRQLSARALLYTEMVTTGAILHGDREKLLGFAPAELPLVLQLGGSDPVALAQCAAIGQQCGYSEINLNVGCPSDRVQNGRFGACLMAEPALVGECVAAMQAAVDIPVSVKCRIGIDRDDVYEPFARFIDIVSQHGCEYFVVHARKAWLDGLSPKENRDIPPLRYDFVRRAKEEFTRARFMLNGGLVDHQTAQTEAITLDGVMVGRAAYRNPWLLHDVDRVWYQQPGVLEGRSREAVVEQMIPYLEQYLSQGVTLGHMVRHMLGLFQGQPGGRQWRRYLSEHAWRRDSGVEIVRAALLQVAQTAARVAA